MFRTRPATFLFISSSRLYSSQPPPSKVPVALIAELRKQTQVSLSKAREALQASNNSIPSALEWLRNDMLTSGAAKAAKVGSRSTSQGVISLSVLGKGANVETAGGVRAALVELNCETDFVGRNELFGKLAQDIAHTAAYISEAHHKQIEQASGDGPVGFHSIPLEMLKEAPLISSDPSQPIQGTIASAIRETIVKVGENITLRRATSVVEDLPYSQGGNTVALRIGSYAHGAQAHTPFCGQLASLALLRLQSPILSQLLGQEPFRKDLNILERSIARQIVGMDTLSVRPSPTNEVEEQALYKQPFITLAGEWQGLPVEEALKKWCLAQGLIKAEAHDGGVEVVDFLRWKVGEDI